MELKIFQVDSFTDRVFKGNPAGVIVLNSWIDDHIMQNVAQENNFSETAFAVEKSNNFYEIRWFTPTLEVDLCGHATLAAARVIFDHYNVHGNELEFYSPKAGPLKVTLSENDLTLDFPVDQPSKESPPNGLYEAIGEAPEECLKGKSDYLLVFKDQATVERLEPNFYLLRYIQARGIICTAPGDDCDFVSRFFAPASGVNEDPVTGSAHTTLTPYWSSKLGKVKMEAKQVSKREGFLTCELKGESVLITGKAVIYFEGLINFEA